MNEDREPIRELIRDQILAELVKAGTYGRTDYELATILNGDKNHIPTRRRDVELHGYCRKTGDRRPTDNGISAIVHVVTDLGQAFHSSGRPVPSRPRRSTAAESSEGAAA